MQNAAENILKSYRAPHIEAPNGAKKVFLHCCCAPCASAIIEAMLANGIRPTLFYFNPNIFPLQEYQKRRSECSRYAEALGLSQIDADSDFSASHNAWLDCVRGLETEPERGGRCQVCFNMRLLETAKRASENGFEVFATTLASSRWKDLNQIERAGEYAHNAYPSTFFWAHNWRKEGLQQRRNELIKEQNFYNQTYCGCEFSLKQNGKEHI